MRARLVRWIAGLASDALSFVAGALFSIAIALWAERVDIKLLPRCQALAILGALGVSTLGFLMLSSELKRGESVAELADDPRMAKLTYINNKLKRVLIYMVVTAASLGITVYLLHG